MDSASKAAYDATREPTAYEKAKGYLSPPSTADKVKAGAADAYAYAKVKQCPPCPSMPVALLLRWGTSSPPCSMSAQEPWSRYPHLSLD